MSDLQVQSTLKHKRKKIGWKTMDGRLTNNIEMSTSHLFNVVKMYYNHLAILTNMPTYGFTKQYQEKYNAWIEKPERTVYVLKHMILELEDRTDWGDRGHELGKWQLETYKSIRESIKRGVPFETIKQLKKNNDLQY
jgi:hypothetical protein